MEVNHMKFSKSEIRRLRKIKNRTIEETIQIDILGFIETIHSNKQNFIDEMYDSEYFGDLGMTFKKKSGGVMGVISVNIKNEDRELVYIFNDQGYESLDDLLELNESTSVTLEEFADIISRNK